MTPALSVIIVNFNTKKLTLDCIGSVVNSKPKADYEIIVIDNGSNDGSVEKLKEPKNIRLFVNDKNLGFSKAVNQGIKKARGRYILLLNSDTLVNKEAIDGLVNFALKVNDAGVVAPKLLNSDKTLQPSIFRFPTVMGAIRQYWFGQKEVFAKYYLDDGKVHEVDAVVGAAFLITNQARLKVGLFDERYFMYFEDLDYCRRVKKVGLKVYYLSNLEVIHYHGASGKKMVGPENQWRRLIPSSKIYHGVLKHYLINFIIWSSQKWKNILNT